jgi:hypothetical protein
MLVPTRSGSVVAVTLMLWAGCRAAAEERPGEPVAVTATATLITKPARADGGGLAPTLVVVSGQTLVASAVATQAPWNADSSGGADASASIQRAIDAVAAATGGVVYLPAGRYRLDRPLRLGWGVTLAGEPVPETAAADATSATWLLAYAGRGDEAAAALITLPPHHETGLLNLTIAYPEQRAGQIVPYPFTIVGGTTTIRGVTLCNSYNGLLIELVNGCMLADIRGTVLKRGLVAPHSTEFSWMHDIQFANATWRAQATAFAGAPLSPADGAALDAFTRANLTGLELGRIDALAIQRFAAVDAALPVLIKKNAQQETHRVFGFGGVVAEFPDRREEVDPWYYAMHYANLDNVPEAQGKTYRFARTPAAARLGADDFTVVTAPPFSAAGDGKADDTRALQSALDHAGQRGGGVVYLPPGEYRLTAPVQVPAGVELRGAVGRGFIRQGRETCTLAISGARPEGDVEAAPAATTLGDGAGIRGLSIVYPDQGRSAARLTPYPWTIRGNGAGVWVIDLMLLNVWNGIDLATHRCDRHLVRGVWGTAFRRGLVVGGCSQDGRLEHIAWSYGPALEAGRGYDQGKPLGSPEDKATLIADWKTNAVNYSFGACSGERAWGLVGFAPQTHVHFRDEGPLGSCRDAEFWLCMFDVAHRSVLQADQGADLRFLGVFATGGDQGAGIANNWVEVAAAFRGPLAILAPTVQPPFMHHPLGVRAEQLQFFGEVSLISGKAATSGPESAPGVDPEAATDRDPRTYWQGPTGSWLQVDLGAIHSLGRCGFASAWAGFGKEYYVPLCELQVSADGVAFTTAGALGSNGCAWADLALTPAVRARFVRLLITKGCPADGLARIAEFRVFAENR